MTATRKLVPVDAFAAGAQAMLEACVAEVRRSAAILRPDELAIALGGIPVRSLRPGEAAPPVDLDPTEEEGMSPKAVRDFDKEQARILSDLREQLKPIGLGIGNDIRSAVEQEIAAYIRNNPTVVIDRIGYIEAGTLADAIASGAYRKGRAE